MAEDNWKKFYDENPPADNLDEIKSQISEFCSYHFANGTPVVLVTVSYFLIIIKYFI